MYFIVYDFILVYNHLHLITGITVTPILTLKPSPIYLAFHSTIHRYSPTEAAKVYDKAVNRKNLIHFNPARALDLLKTGQPKPPLSDQEKRDIVEEYLDVRHLHSLPHIIHQA